MKKKRTYLPPLALTVALNPHRSLLQSSPSGKMVDDDDWNWDDGGAMVKEAGNPDLWDEDWSD